MQPDHAQRPDPSAPSRPRFRATTCVRSKSETEPAEDACEARQLEDGTFIAIIADGIGAARHGRDAAVKTCATFAANFRNRPRAWSVAKTLEEITRHLNRQLLQEGLAKHDGPELATTVVAAVLDGPTLHVLNAGDSRAYRFRRNGESDGTLEQISRDHRDTHQPNLITQALGLADSITPNSFAMPLEAGDTILLCSDGLTDVLDDATLTGLLAKRVGARGLVEAARERATPATLDDISAVVVDVLETGGSASGSAEILPVPEILRAGDMVDGFTLRQSFRASDRIWLAAQAGKQYVLKFPPVDARTNEESLNLFIREMWNATTLRAEFFPAAFVPENATARYYALEYIHAPTLRQWLDRNGPLDTAGGMALLKMLLEADTFLLRHDFVHGDLKPDNILVVNTGSRNGAAVVPAFKLIDLGSVAEVFAVNTRAGTPSYLAPERFSGGAVCEGTEIFSMGATVYESLTGHLPYGEVEPFQMPVFKAAKPPSQRNPHLPGWLESVLLRAIARNPADRYRSYSEVRYELDNPSRVKPFRSADAPLMERNPELFMRILLAVSFVANAYLIFRLLSR